MKFEQINSFFIKKSTQIAGAYRAYDMHAEGLARQIHRRRHFIIIPLNIRPEEMPKRRAEKNCSCEACVHTPLTVIFSGRKPQASNCNRLASHRSICHLAP